MTGKTDNHNPKVKLDLRRFFLRKYHDAPPIVFDCCQGSAVMWTQLQKEFAVSRYWGVDLKPKKGRLKIDSVKVLEQPGWDFDVIDVDTYGEPWKHWLALLPNLAKPATVFLTIATIRMGGGGNISREARKLLGIDGLSSLPQSFCGKLSTLAGDLALACGSKSATIVEAVEAVSTGNARYIGVRLEPKNGLPAAPTASKPKHRKAVKEQCNV